MRPENISNIHSKAINRSSGWGECFSSSITIYALPEAYLACVAGSDNRQLAIWQIAVL
jgi:hypothetical protein